MWQIDSVTPDKCNYNCDNLASCACGLVYGDYKCVCPKGYSGSGYVGECNGKKEFTWLSFLESPHVSMRKQGGRYSSDIGLI